MFQTVNTQTVQRLSQADLPLLSERYPTNFDSDSAKRHLSRRHLSVLNFKFNFIFNGGCTREEQIALSLKRHLFPHGGRKRKASWICFSTLPPILNIFSNFSSSALKRHLLKRYLTLSEHMDQSCTSTLKTITSLNKEARLLKFHFSLAIIAFGDGELKCSKCYDRMAKIASMTSKCCDR